MRRFFIASALIASSAAPAFAAAPARTFVEDGETYSYTIDHVQDGSLMLRGRILGTGDRFALHVSGTHVAGAIGGRPVDFSVPAGTAARAQAEAGTAVASN